MKIRIALALCLASVAATYSVAATAQENRDVGSGWSLSDNGKTCFIGKITVHGETTHSTLFGSGSIDSFSFASRALTDVTQGGEETLQIYLGGSGPKDVKASGFVMDNGGGGFFMSTNNAPFAEQDIPVVLEVRRGGQSIHSIDLTGIREPIMALLECGKKYKK